MATQGGAGNEIADSTLPLWRLTPLEIAWGWVPGRCQSVPAVEPGRSDLSPRKAIEPSILRALIRPPCVVMFSGGRDSSLVLAAAVDVARRHGLPAPVAMTMRFPDVPESEESSWQELVIRHVGSPEWVKLEFRDEIDAVGTFSADLMLRHGLMWAPSMQMVAAVAAHAGGGSILTGDSGDEVFGRHRMMAARNVAGRRGRAPLSWWKEVARDSVPAPLRRPVRRREVRDSMTTQAWLRPAASEALVDRIVKDEVTLPLRWDRSVGTLGQRKTWLMHEWNRGVLATEWSVHFESPFTEPVFTRALQCSGRAWGYASRSGLMRALFSDLLPHAVLVRRDKATFNDAVFSRPTQEFIASWNGSGLDEDLVDVDRLAAHWRSEDISFGSVMLLKQAWLHAHGGIVREVRSHNHLDDQKGPSLPSPHDPRS